jgi:hypothetical protein
MTMSMAAVIDAPPPARAPRAARRSSAPSVDERLPRRLVRQQRRQRRADRGRLGADVARRVAVHLARDRRVEQDRRDAVRQRFHRRHREAFVVRQKRERARRSIQPVALVIVDVRAPVDALADARGAGEREGIDARRRPVVAGKHEPRVGHLRGGSRKACDQVRDVTPREQRADEQHERLARAGVRRRARRRRHGRTRRREQDLRRWHADPALDLGGRER